VTAPAAAGAGDQLLRDGGRARHGRRRGGWSWAGRVFAL